MKKKTVFTKLDPDGLEDVYKEVRWKALQKLALYAEVTGGDEPFPPTIVSGNTRTQEMRAAECPWNARVVNPPPGKEGMEYTLSRLEMHHTVMSHVIDFSADEDCDLVAAWFLASPMNYAVIEKRKEGAVCELDLAVTPMIDKGHSGAFMHFVIKNGVLLFGLCGINHQPQFMCTCEWSMYQLPDLAMWGLEEVGANQEKE